VSGTPVWERGARRAALPPLQGEAEASVCVVGLGGSGLAAVGELLRHGASVIGIDSGRVAGGAAGRNGGFLLAGAADFHHRAVERHGRARAAAIHRLTLAELDRMSSETPSLVRRVGSLRIADSAAEEEDCRAQLEAMREDGLPAERYAGPEGRGLLIPTDGAFDPLARARELARRAVVDGARLFEGTPALDITGDAVVTPGGRIRCERVIVAVDGRLERVVPALAGRVRTARLQMLATGPAPGVSIPRPVYARYGMEYWQQLPDGAIAVGGFRDLGGDGEWTHDTDPADPIQARLERLLRDRIGTDAPVTHRWGASVGFTETGLPLLEETDVGVLVAGGYSGTGNVLGAICGRAAAAMALGERSGAWELLASGGSGA
jgi:gamma-glutamylputrescine oxidase